MTFDSQDPVEPEKWDHRHYFGTLGMLYANRFTKNFEIGAELSAGYSQAVFPNLVDEAGSLGSSNFLFELGGRIGLNPSYNFSIDINPNLKYLLSLSALKDFNGLIFGIGFAAHYRFGQDPDSPAAIIRSLRFEEASIPAMFAAMQSYYAKNAVGLVSVTNIEKHAISDIEISFFQAGYMDSPTPSASISELGPGESRDIELFASFNQEVFRTEGITPLTGEIIVTYSSKGKPVEQRHPVSYDLHDKTAITWDDDRKVAAFITPADSALRNYSSFIRQSTKDQVIPAYTEELQFAMQVYHALGEIGILYQVDPTSPFTSVQENPMVVDSISLPRDTLKRITGDCDDLTVLFNSILETVGIETGFITTPGHIYTAFNTKVPGRLFKQLHPDRSMTINVEDQLWVPVEITMIGKGDFLDAWRKGVEEWTMYEAAPEKRGFYLTRSSQELYRPVGLKETDLGLQYGDKENIVRGFRDDMGELIEAIVTEYRDTARETGKKADWNKLGITYAKFSQYRKAEQAFSQALYIDPDYLNAKVNLGNVAYLEGNYRGALAQFNTALSTLQRQGQGESPVALKVLLNISRMNYELKRYADSKVFFEQAYSIDPEETQKYSYLGKVASDETRAAAAVDTEHDIFFIGDE
jgi:tetratricopeptide (TPR) repeat protein